MPKAKLSNWTEKQLREAARDVCSRAQVSDPCPYRLSQDGDGTWRAEIFPPPFRIEADGTMRKSRRDTSKPFEVQTGFRTARLAMLGAIACGGSYQMTATQSS